MQNNALNIQNLPVQNNVANTNNSMKLSEDNKNKVQINEDKVLESKIANNNKNKDNNENKVLESKIANNNKNEDNNENKVLESKIANNNKNEDNNENKVLESKVVNNNKNEDNNENKVLESKVVNNNKNEDNNENKVLESKIADDNKINESELGKEQNKDKVLQDKKDENKYIAQFEKCNSGEELDKAKEKLLKENQEKTKQLNDQIDKFDSDCYEQIRKLENEKLKIEIESYDYNIDETRKAELKKLIQDKDEQIQNIKNNKNKQINDLKNNKKNELKALEKEGKEIEKAYDICYENLFNKKYEQIQQQYNEGTLKYDEDIFGALSNSVFNGINFYYSMNNMKQFVNMQHLVGKLVKYESLNSTCLKENIVNKFFEIINNLNETQLGNLSMLYYQIDLHPSGEINTKKSMQNFDDFCLYDLLCHYNGRKYNRNYIILNRELQHAYINYYINHSETNIEDIIKHLKKNNKAVINEYNNKIYKTKTNSIYKEKIKKYKYLVEYYEKERKEYLGKLNNITERELDSSIKDLTEKKYLESFNILVNATLKLYEIYQNNNKN